VNYIEAKLQAATFRALAPGDTDFDKGTVGALKGIRDDINQMMADTDTETA
jgi:hypothetical protein